MRRTFFHRCKCETFVFHHAACRIEHTKYRTVGNAVVHAQTIFAVCHQAGLAHYHQLLRNVGLPELEHRLDMTDTLFAVSQDVEDLQSNRMR